VECAGWKVGCLEMMPSESGVELRSCAKRRDMHVHNMHLSGVLQGIHTTTHIATGHPVI
jgi:hypothetical protein